MDMHTRRIVTGLSLVGLLVLTGCAPEGAEPVPPLTPGQISGITESTGANNGKTSAGSTGNGGDKAPTSSDKVSSDTNGVAKDSPDELTGIEGRQPIEVEKSPVLPASFPNAEVPLPEGATIDDAGERQNGSWFVTLRYNSLDAARAGLSQITDKGNFTIISEDGDDVHFVHRIERDAISVEALGFINDEGNPLLSLVIDVIQ